MKQIRYGVFETNSSSTHSLTFCSDEEYEKFESGKMLYHRWDHNLVAADTLLASNSLDSLSDYASFKDFFSGYDDLEIFHETYTTKSGEVVHAFGKYGYDG